MSAVAVPLGNRTDGLLMKTGFGADDFVGCPDRCSYPRDGYAALSPN